MTNATKTLATVFVILLVIVGLDRWTSGSNQSSAFNKNLVAVDTANVSRIEIDRPVSNSSVILQREDTQWKVKNGDQVYDADETQVQRALSQLANLSVNSVVTRDTSKFTRYKVDSTGTRITLYNGDQNLSSLVLGAPQILGRRNYNTYIRPADAQAVYTVKGYLSTTYNRDVDGWRDKAVWQFKPKNIERIDYIYPADSSFSARKVADNTWLSDDDTLKLSAMRSVTNRLARLSASGFDDGSEPEQMGEGLYTLQFRLNNGVQKRVELYLPTDKSSAYRATATDYPYVFKLNKSSWNRSVLKSRSQLLKH